MKTIYISALALFFSANLSAQTVNQEELNQFVENQKTPFLEGHVETFLLAGIAWERIYGENEYVLTPIMQNINDYFNRIKFSDNAITGVYKSNFSFIKVEVTNSSKTTLNSMNIVVPDYVQNEVVVYLPQIDIDRLNQEFINFIYLPNYGKQNPNKFNPINNKALLYSENFENSGSEIPGTTYSSQSIGASNCGWKDVGCVSKSGFWSAWCAGDGAACTPICSNSDYVNNMESDFWKSTFITNIAGNNNLSFNWWMNFDMNESGTNDILFRFFNFGSSWQLSSLSYNSSSPGEGSGNYEFQQIPITGPVSSYSFQFRFVSNSVGTAQGVYIDDISLTGDATTGVNDINLANKISIYPNPTNGVFTIESENMQSIEITSISGEIIKTIKQNKSNKVDVDLKAYSAGVYFVKITTDKGNATKKLILN